MNIVCRTGALVLGLLPFALGCAEAGDMPSGIDGAPGIRPAEINPGAGGNNGLFCDDYHDHEAELAIATEVSLTAPFSAEISDDVLETGLLDTEEGLSVLSYAVKCALPEGVQVTFGNTILTGKGYLATTATWRTAPLSAAARDDLLACVIVHVNSTVGVDILLSGEQVIDDGGDHDDFDVPEALWHVQQNAAGEFEYHVWPLSPFAEECEADPWEALQKRICGQNPEDCNFIPRYDLEDCAQDLLTGGYTCDGQPVLETTLKSADVDVLHPTCAPRPR